MPTLLEHESNQLVKALVASDSGRGKTGALASLVDAGYNLRVLDFDNGLSVLKGYVKDKSKFANVSFITLRDELKLAAGRFNIHKAFAFDKAMKTLDKGGEEWGAGSTIPPLTEWTPKDILVVDTLGMMARSCLFMVMQLNNAATKAPEIQHYGQAMENIERFISQVTSPAVPCNVLIHTHLYHSKDGMNIYPEALGDKLGPKIPRYFDNFLSISLTGGARKFKTKKDGLLACKTAVPIKDDYELPTGYINIFADLLGVKVSDLPLTS